MSPLLQIRERHGRGNSQEKQEILLRHFNVASELNHLKSVGGNRTSKRVYCVLLLLRNYSLTNNVVSGFVESLRKSDGVSQFRQYHMGALPVQDVYYVYYMQKGFVFGIGYVSKRGE